MFGLRGNDSLKNLVETIQRDPSIKLTPKEEEGCIYIHPNKDMYHDGCEYIQHIYDWLCRGFYPGLRVKNVFQRYDVNTILVCVRDDERFYQCMVDCFDGHCQRSRPFED